MSSPDPAIRDIVRDAQWLAHRYDPGHDAVHMRFVPRARHGDIPFLTDEYLGATDAPLVLRLGDAMEQAPPRAPIHFLFHSAYCCSTLLAAAMDIPGIAMGLKEPVLLNDLIGWRHRGAKGPEVARVLDASLHLLARPFGPGEAVVVKPSNVINPLIPAIMSLRPDARALLLHAPLEPYLASIARKGMWGRLWVRDLFQKLVREGMIAPLGIAPSDYLGLTDIQVAAVGCAVGLRQRDGAVQGHGVSLVSFAARGPAWRRPAGRSVLCRRSGLPGRRLAWRAAAVAWRH